VTEDRKKKENWVRSEKMKGKEEKKSKVWGWEDGMKGSQAEMGVSH